MQKLRILIGKSKDGEPMLKRIFPRGVQEDPHLIGIEKSDAGFDDDGDPVSGPTRIFWIIDNELVGLYRFGKSDTHPISGDFITIAPLKKGAPSIPQHGQGQPAAGAVGWKEIPQQLTATKVGIRIWNFNTLAHDVPWKYTLKLYKISDQTAFELDPMITNRR